MHNLFFSHLVSQIVNSSAARVPPGKGRFTPLPRSALSLLLLLCFCSSFSCSTPSRFSYSFSPLLFPFLISLFSPPFPFPCKFAFFIIVFFVGDPFSGFVSSAWSPANYLSWG